MKDMLDRDMPRRRRYPLWLWPGSAALVVLLGAASLYGYLSFAPQEQTTIPGSPAEIAGTVPTPASELQDGQVTTATVAADEISDISGSGRAISTRTAAVASADVRVASPGGSHSRTAGRAQTDGREQDRSAVPGSGKTAHTERSVSTAAITADQAATTLPGHTALQDQVQPAVVTQVNDAVPGNSHTAAEPANEHIQTDAVAASAVAETTAGNIADPNALNIPAISAAAPAVGLGWFAEVGAGTLVSPAARLTVSASAGIQYRFGSSWRIDGSLGYSYTDVSQEFHTYLGGRNTLKDNVHNGAGSGGGQPIQSNEYLASLHLGNAQTAFARTTAVFSRKQWYVQAGLEFHRRINDPLKRAYQITDVETAGPGSGPLLSAEEITQDYLLFNSWDLRLHTGIGYRLNSYLALSLDYRHGLIGMVKYPVAYRDKFLHRGLDLGLRFSF